MVPDSTLKFLVACWGQVNYAIFGNDNGDRCAKGAKAAVLRQELALIIMDFFIYFNKANSNGVESGKSIMSLNKNPYTCDASYFFPG